MKLLWWIMLAAGILVQAQAMNLSFLNHGTLSVNLTASSQQAENLIVGSKTRTNATGIVTLQITKSTVTNTTLNAASVLQLIENSLNTNFPAGSRLTVAISLFHTPALYVTDSTGTNIVWGPGTNLFIGTMAGEHHLTSEQETIITTALPGGGMTYSDQRSTTITQTVILGYDDTGLPTRDGTHTHFQVNCLVVEKSSLKGGTEDFHATLKMQGFGYGVIRDNDVVLQGSANAIISGKLF